MATIKDGGPAFAAVAAGPAGDVYESPGMTLRDWFAGQALAGMMANPSVFDGDDRSIKACAPQCYAVADAMLAAREASSDD